MVRMSRGLDFGDRLVGLIEAALDDGGDEFP